MLIIKTFILLSLGWMFIQDLIERAIFVLVFPVLLFLFIVSGILTSRDLGEAMLTSAINFGMMALGALVIFIYLRFRRPALSGQLVGWGDVLFLACISCYLSVINFVFFNLISLAIIVLVIGIAGFFRSFDTMRVPLAGLQALILLLLLVIDWSFGTLHINDDGWFFQWLKI